MVDAEGMVQRSEHFDDPSWGAEQLKRISIFKEFNEDELTTIYQKGEIRHLKPSAHAVIEGEPSRGVFIILSGSVSVYKNDSATGTMHRLAHLDEGSSFGELSLFDSAPRSATVSADTTCHLFHLDASTFESFLEESGDNAKARFYKKCAEDMSERFRVLNSDYIVSQQLLWKYALRKDREALDSGSSSSDGEKELDFDSFAEDATDLLEED